MIFGLRLRLVYELRLEALACVCVSRRISPLWRNKCNAGRPMKFRHHQPTALNSCKRCEDYQDFSDGFRSGKKRKNAQCPVPALPWVVPLETIRKSGTLARPIPFFGRITLLSCRTLSGGCPVLHRSFRRQRWVSCSPRFSRCIRFWKPCRCTQ